MVQRCKSTDHMNSLVDNNIVHNVSYSCTICTEIDNRFNRILHFADQNVVPSITNGTSSMFHNNLISSVTGILPFLIYLYGS